MLGGHRLGRADRVGARDQVLEPHVPPWPHGAFGAGRPDHHDRLQVRQIRYHLVDRLLDRDELALAPGAVRDDQGLGLGDLQPLAHRGGSEAPEDDGVRRADAGTGEHGHDDLGDHRQVDADDVALPDPARLERAGQPLYVVEELGVGQLAFLAFLTPPVEGDPVAAAGQHVPVEAVVGHVDGPVGEPGVERRVGVVEHRGERRVPVQPLPRLRRPPCFRVGGGLLVDGRVPHLGPGGEAGRRRERPDLQQALETLTERRI